MGQSVAYVSDSVDSCTREVEVFACLHPDGSGQRIFNIDTPGYDNSTHTDYEILAIITRKRMYIVWRQCEHALSLFPVPVTDDALSLAAPSSFAGLQTLECHAVIL